MRTKRSSKLRIPEVRTVEKIAARWRVEYGENVGWYLSAKIRQLEYWGDADGALRYERVLTLVHATSVKPSRNPNPA